MQRCSDTISGRPLRGDEALLAQDGATRRCTETHAGCCYPAGRLRIDVHHGLQLKLLPLLYACVVECRCAMPDSTSIVVACRTLHPSAVPVKTMRRRASIAVA
jgi:hypothetical protein